MAASPSAPGKHDPVKKSAAVEPEQEDSPQESMVERLEKEIETLSARCARLEAQNILVSVQQLDLLARGIAFTLSALSIYLYWKCLRTVIPLVPALVEKWLPQLQRFAWIPWVLHPLTLRSVTYALMFVPYIHHKTSHGLAHRRFEVFAIAFIVVARIKMCRWRERMFVTTEADNKRVPSFGVDMNEDAIWDANYEISARFLYISILRLRGLWTKSAQYLSSRADFMPASYVRELRKLQDEAPATDWAHVKQMLARVPGLLEKLTDVDETPIASASIGQVHTARLASNGEKVVIKVQHPFARTLLTDDFWSLKVIARIVTWLEPEYEFFEILMREWAVEAKKELNFLSEANNLKSAQASIDLLIPDETSCVQTNSTPSCPKSISFQVEIPRPLKHLSTDSVLVMSYCEGVRVDNLKQIQEWDIPREAVMDAVAQTFAHMMYVTDVFNGDPHPGNIFIRPGTAVSKEGFTVVLLDWGLAKRLPEQKRLAFCQMAYAASTFDLGLLLDAFKTIGLRMKRENVAEDLEGLRFVLRDMAPGEKQRKRIKAKIKTDRERMNSKQRGEKMPMESKAYPGEFFFFVRVNELLHGLGSRLKVEMTYLDVLKPYAERGLSLSSLYSDKDELLKREVPAVVVSDKNLNESIEKIITELDQDGMIAGAQVSVLDSDGKVLSNVCSGHMGGLKKSVPMRPDALILGYSCTKAITATLAHLMVEEGYLSYDESVAERVWKAFCPSESAPDELRSAMSKSVGNVGERWVWKRSITLRHILTHSAGLWAALPAKMTIKSMASCELSVAAFEFNPDAPEETLLPSRRPGEKCEYHFMSFGWLVAGTLCGAYSLRHGGKSVTFEDVYRAVLLPKLSAETLNSGFRPCGGNGTFPMAQTDTAVDALSRVVQMRREAESMGEDGPKHLPEMQSAVLQEVQESFRGKEFLLDQRVWNCQEALNANVPAAGGRFTSLGLAKFYNELGSGRLISLDTLATATGVVSHENTANELQGQTAMTSNNSEDGVSLGMGYQLIRFDSDKEAPAAFGHAGVGGSIGFYHEKERVSVAIMLNKADADKNTAKKIIHEISKHYGW